MARRAAPRRVPRAFHLSRPNPRCLPACPGVEVPTGSFAPRYQVKRSRGTLPPAMEKAHLHGNRQQLLVVDDEPFFTAFLRGKFSERGYSVSTAGDALEALTFVSQVTAPLVVLLDLMLPRVSGYQVLRELAKGSNAS